MEIKNFTPHPINILDANNKEIAIFQPEGVPIRLKSEVKKISQDGDILLTKTIFGEPEGLPGLEKDTLLIVSQLVKSACPSRGDLVVPAEVVRDSTGRIIGCRSLGI